MEIIKGKFAEAKVFSEDLEQYARAQLQMICDNEVAEKVPSGFLIRKNVHHLAEEFDFARLHCCKHINEEKAKLSLGSLGGGNHCGRDIKRHEIKGKKCFFQCT